MWLFTRHGFFEAASAGPSAGSLQPSVHLRARRRSHLRNLQQALPGLADLPVEDAGEDGYRLTLHPELWQAVLRRLGSELDYRDFRQAVREAGRCDRAFWEKLHEVATAVRAQTGA